jgi:hypothetical protein
LKSLGLDELGMEGRSEAEGDHLACKRRTWTYLKRIGRARGGVGKMQWRLGGHQSLVEDSARTDLDCPAEPRVCVRGHTSGHRSGSEHFSGSGHISDSGHDICS